MAEENKGGKVEVLKGSLFLKIVILLAIGLVISVFLFGVKLNLWDLFWAGLKILVGIVIIYLIFKGIQYFLTPPPFSPTQNFKEKLIRCAKLSKPFNVQKLFLRGEDMRVYSEWGNIKGLLFIPYLAAKPKKDEEGKILYVAKLDHSGKPVVDDKTNEPVMVPATEFMTEADGDWFFITSRGLLSSILGKPDLVRAHRSQVSEMGNSVWIKDVNLVPVGDYHYPAKQWQTDILRIKQQHQAETIIETYMHFLDNIAHVTQMSLGGDPTFQKIMLANSEAIAQRNSGVLVQ